MLRYINIVASALVVMTATTEAAQGPGAGVSITEGGVHNAKNVIMPYIFAIIKNLTLPEVDFDGGYLKNIVIQVPEPPVDSVAIKFDQANNGAELTCADNTVHMTSDFHYSYLFFTVDGQADIHITKAGVDVEIDVGTQPGTPAYELAPKLTTQKMDINVNPDNVDIKLTGGLVSKIANVLIPLIKSSVIPAIINEVTGMAKTAIDTTIDQDLKIYGNQQEIPFLSGVTADYAQLAGPQFSSSVFQMGVNGTFFDSKDVQKPTIVPATFALRDTSGKDAQAYLTDYTIVTALQAGFQTGLDLDITYLLKEYLKLTVTTDVIGKVIPQILTKYGSGKAVSISGKWMKAPATAEFVPGVMAFSGSLQATVTIDKQVAIKATFDEFAGELSLHSTDGKIFGKVTKATAGSIDSQGFVTTLGLTNTQLQQELQTQIDTEIGKLNKNLTTGVVIPTIMGIDVSDVEIKFMKGYAELGLSLSSKSWTQIAQALGEWKKHLLAKKPSAPHSIWKLKKYASKKIDKVSNMVDENSDRLSHFLDKATDQLSQMIFNQTKELQDYMPKISIDTNDGEHWDLSSYLNETAKNLTDAISEGADKFQEALESEIKDFNEEVPETKDKIVSELPDVEIKSSNPKSIDDFSKFLDEGFGTLDSILNDAANGLDDLLN